jgi:hypothetical protein
VVTVFLYVEGGGDYASLKSDCRRAFSKFLEKAGLKGCLPRIVACGGRTQAYDMFCRKVKDSEKDSSIRAFLLIDSEFPVSVTCETGDEREWKPWQHLEEKGNGSWKKIDHVSDSQCHFMVECMESWLLADRENLKKFYGKGFAEKKLPVSSAAIERLDKKEIYKSLEEATVKTTKGKYSKGGHSFQLLESANPELICDASKWAKRFVDTVKDQCNAVYALL